MHEYGTSNGTLRFNFSGSAAKRNLSTATLQADAGQWLPKLASGEWSSGLAFKLRIVNKLEFALLALAHQPPMLVTR